jgi:hypothetical protein
MDQFDELRAAFDEMSAGIPPMLAEIDKLRAALATAEASAKVQASEIDRLRDVNTELHRVLTVKLATEPHSNDLAHARGVRYGLQAAADLIRDARTLSGARMLLRRAMRLVDPDRDDDAPDATPAASGGQTS